ncbi:glycine N-acyltransferase-like protein 3 isoform X1 [Anolis carolinensis]|uniref:glycine N-acyltransferase-like protein 3 isoform X1 n=1 Tax=Anolis carolinensis TaxID=28377 RepID=UPI002F2B6DDA
MCRCAHHLYLLRRGQCQWGLLGLLTCILNTAYNSTDHCWKSLSDFSCWAEPAEAQSTHRMLVLSSQDELQVLKEELRCCFPESLKVYGAVLNICQGNAFHQEVLVDSWPNFQVVIARPQREVLVEMESTGHLRNDFLSFEQKIPSETNYFTQSCAVFCRLLSAFEELVKDTDAIDWKQEFLLQVLQVGVYQKSRSLAAARCSSPKLLTRSQVFILQNPSHLPAAAARSGSKLKPSSLKITHAALLNETWSVGGTEQSLQYLSQLIQCFPSSCLLDARGCPISWVLLDQFGSLTHAYTMPEHRGKGYIQMVMAALTKKLHSIDFPVYGDVLENNTAMQRAMKNMGAHFTSCFLFYDLYTPQASVAFGSPNTQPVTTESPLT